MSNETKLLTPVGRLVQGSLYDPQTTDIEGRPLTYSSGPNAGQPRVNFFFAIAIPKGAEQHWNQTEWGAIIWAVGQAGFPKGQANGPSFAWKIKDGDSQIPNADGKKPCENEGFPRHWILNFSSSYAPGIYNADGTRQIMEKNAINRGDYIQVAGNVSSNDSAQQPGVYLNHQMVALAGYGERIVGAFDAKAVGFGKAPLPAGASPIPLAGGFNPAPVSTSLSSTPGVLAPAPVVPHIAILTPPMPVAPQRVMTAKANGLTYDQYIQAGWTDALLIEHGMMVG